MAGQGVQQRTGEADWISSQFARFPSRSRDILVNPRSYQRAGGGGPPRPFITRDDGKVPFRRSRASPDALSIVPSLVNGKEQGFQVMWAARFGRAVADERRI